MRHSAGKIGGARSCPSVRGSKDLNSRLLLGAYLALLACGGAQAGPTRLDKMPPYVAEQFRASGESRAVRIRLAQSRISVLVDIGRVARDGGSSGGLANYIVSRQDDKPEILTELAVRKAESAIQPLRVALADFDIAGMALNAGKVGISAVDWFKAGPVEEEREPRFGNPSDFVAAAPGNQAALMTIGHFLSSDFSRVEIRAEISLFAKATASSKNPVALSHQRILCVVELAQPSLDEGENIRRWSADHGALARRALTDGYASLARMIPRSLMLTQSDVAAFEMKSRAKTFTGGRYGPVIERDGAEPRLILLWEKGLISVQTMPVSAH